MIAEALPDTVILKIKCIYYIKVSTRSIYTTPPLTNVFSKSVFTISKSVLALYIECPTCI